MEFINRLRLDGSAVDFALQIGILLSGVLLACRSADNRKIAIIATVACIWTYHGRYDFVFLLIPASLLIVESVTWHQTLILAAVALVGIALTESVVHGMGAFPNVMRMAGRLGIVAVLVGSAWCPKPQRTKMLNRPAAI